MPENKAVPENFDVHYERSKLDDNIEVITSDASLAETLAQINKNDVDTLTAYRTKSDKQLWSVVSNETSTDQEPTLASIDKLAQNIHFDYDKLLSANRLILKYVDSDGYMGYAYGVIRANIPVKYKLTFGALTKDESEKSKIDEVEQLIADFNDNVKIESVIREAVSKAYLEGNAPMTLRIDGDQVVIDMYPLNIAYPSEYKINGDRVVEFNVGELKSLLSKPYKLTRKKAAVYFENLKAEIKANYPKAVYDAFVNGDKYVRLDSNTSDCVTVNAMSRRFGVSPFFRCLRPLVVLNNIEEADVADSKARSKKIIFQKLRHQLMGEDGTRKGITEAMYSHGELTKALKTNLCAYTAPPYVESLEFVTSKSTNEDASRQLTQYTSMYLQSLGIYFIDTEASNYAGVNVSVAQIIRTVNAIVDDVERVINKMYRAYLKSRGIDVKYAPEIVIDDAETMEPALRLDLAKFAYGTLNASRDTTFGLIGLDLQDEVSKRKLENENNLDDIFTPRATSYTYTTDEENTGGAPRTNDDTDKQQYDHDRNQTL